MTPEERRVLARVRAELERTYGDRLRRVILYGSRARGDARPDSDYDVLAVIEPPGRRWDELMRLADLGADLIPELGAVVSIRPASLADLDRPTLLMENVRREGVAV
jgi:uncharacterized protein